MVLLPFILNYPGFMFEQDNARPHTVRVAINCLRACQTLPWPAKSPDLSLSEHVWNMIGRQLHFPGMLIRNTTGHYHGALSPYATSCGSLHPGYRQCRLDLPTSGNWSVTDWRRVIFSDEPDSASVLMTTARVWRRTGQRSDPAFIVERHTAISQGVTVWGAISWDTRSSLVVLQGTLTARRYVDDILTPIVLPMLSSHPGAIYQQDNARPHTARLSQQCLQGYDVLPWPARSPDLSPIEYVLDALGRQLQPS
ncbi:DDE_3 domain-containing protein [Trichonephila clavipes]|nr:DDE_3 domain-containing protein [Trichonephila clavipes]